MPPGPAKVSAAPPCNLPNPDVVVEGVRQTETPVTQVIYNNRDKVLIVGDSITHNSNFRLLEKATNTVVHTDKAYAADYDSRRPNKNVKYFARNAARRNKFKVVLIQSPSVDITNMDTTNNSPEAIDGYKKVVKISTEKMFETASVIIEENDSIEKVIILDRTARFDSKREDPHGLKPTLAEY